MAIPREKPERINISLPPSQIAWLRSQTAGISGTLKALITESMAMQNLKKSVARTKKKS